MVGSVTPDMIAADAGAFFDFLESRPEVKGAAFGVFGYCMGGRTSVIVAGRQPDRVAAAASFHGGGLVTDDPNSPHLLADQMKATVYVGRRGERRRLHRRARRNAGQGADRGRRRAHGRVLSGRARLRGAGQPALRQGGRGPALGRAGAAVRRLAVLTWTAPAVGRACAVRDHIRVDNEVSTTHDGRRRRRIADKPGTRPELAAGQRRAVRAGSRPPSSPAPTSSSSTSRMRSPPRTRPRARGNVIKWLGEGNGDWVRVNGFGTQWWADDLEMLSGTSVGGVMLAMVESVDHVTETAKRLPNVPIVALVETARGLERITEIAAAKGTFRLAFGIGDFRRDTGFGDNPTTLAYARSRFTIAAKAAHLPSAIDGPTVGSSALKLSEATAVSAEFGMTGKICLTPDQCATVNEGLSPSLDEITWAKEFFLEFERDGGEIRNGSDLPRIARANKILDLARAYGIEPSEFDDVDEPGAHPRAVGHVPLLILGRTLSARVPEGRDRPEDAAGRVKTRKDRQHDQHDEHDQPIGPAVADVPPDDGEEHRTDEHHEVAPIALIGRRHLSDLPAPLGRRDQVADALVDAGLQPGFQLGPIIRNPFQQVHVLLDRRANVRSL